MAICADHSVSRSYSEHPTSWSGSTFRLAWTHRIPEDRSDGILVLPDGAADVLWIDDELIVAGPDRAAQRERTTPGTTIAGLRFARGAASAWLGVGMRELVGLRVPLRDVIGRRRADEMAEPLHAVADPTQLSAAMERAVAGTADPNGAHFAGSVIEAIRTKDGDAVVSAALRATGLTERTLRRRCDQVFGYGPRTLSRVLRLQRLLALLQVEPAITLATAAAASGYADQPHMTREVRVLTMMSPAALAALASIEP